MARRDPRVVFIGSDLGSGTLKEMKEELPKQFFMEGISEQHLIGFAAGLAKEGFIPFVNTIANFFTRRALEQIAVDIALHELPVRLLASGGGMVYAPLGPTHTAIEDLAIISTVPKMRIFAPCDANEMRALIHSSYSDSGPWYVRFGKGGESIISPSRQPEPTKPKFFGDTSAEILFLTTGVIIHEALDAIRELKYAGTSSVAAIHFPELTNIFFESWKDSYRVARKVIVAEEHIPQGGLFSRILHIAHSENLETRKMVHSSLPFKYLHNYGSQKEHFRAHNLDAVGLVSIAMTN
jgi:transketolase